MTNGKLNGRQPNTRNFIAEVHDHCKAVGMDPASDVMQCGHQEGEYYFKVTPGAAAKYGVPEEIRNGDHRAVINEINRAKA